MPKGKRLTLEQIVANLRRGEKGEAAEAVCRSVNISEATLYRWKQQQQYGAMELDEVKELKALRGENARLKCLVAGQALNIQVLKEVNSKNGEPIEASARGAKRGCGGHVFVPAGVPLSRAGAIQPRLPTQAAGRTSPANGGGNRGTVAKASALRLPPVARDGAASRALLMAAMGLEAIYRRPNLSKAAKAHPIYPYLLRDRGFALP